MPMTIEQYTTLELKTNITDFEKLKINVIDLAETIGLDFRKRINEVKDFTELEPFFERIMDEMDTRYFKHYTNFTKLKYIE